MDDEMRIVHAGAVRSVVRRAGQLAERQFGAIARWQLLELGCTRSQIANWLRVERLHPFYPGVYAWGRRSLPTGGELAAALLYAGSGAALGGISALWWLELLGRRPREVHVVAPGRAASRRGLLIRHPQAIQRKLHRGLPVVSLPQALLAAAPDLRHDSLRLVLARAEFRKLLSLTSLQAALGRERPGTRVLRAAMDAHLPQLARCTNGFERRFVLLCESFGLEIPDPSERIGRYRPDMLWRKHRLIVELDGEDAHSSPAQLRSDAARQAYLESLGYTVLRFSWWELEFEPGKVVAEVRAHLSSS